MKDVQATLRRIDEEITFNRQEIARRQVDIARLEDTRRVLMGLQEADATAATDRKTERIGAINGAHARPVLIVRKVTEEGEPGAEGAPLGIVAGGKRKGLPRLRRVQEGERRSKRKKKPDGKIRERILAFLKPGDEPIASADLANNLGLPMGEEHRKPMQNALYAMRAKGVVERDAENRYFRPPGQAAR